MPGTRRGARTTGIRIYLLERNPHLVRNGAHCFFRLGPLRSGGVRRGDDFSARARRDVRRPGLRPDPDPFSPDGECLPGLLQPPGAQLEARGLVFRRLAPLGPCRILCLRFPARVLDQEGDRSFSHRLRGPSADQKRFSTEETLDFFPAGTSDRIFVRLDRRGGAGLKPFFSGLTASRKRPSSGPRPCVPSECTL